VLDSQSVYHFPSQGAGAPRAVRVVGSAPGLPGSAMFTAGSACSGMYRGLKLWEAAVNEAGSLDQADVIGALDHARIAQGPGGPAEMVPGQHHVRMNMYIARSEGGTFKVVKNLGHTDPKEGQVGL